MNTSLKPRLDAEVESLRRRPAELFDTAARSYAPLLVVMPEIVKRNVREFVTVFDELAITAKLFAAHKATHSQAALSAVRMSGGNIDVASVRELHDAFAAGFSKDQMVATGPKSTKFLEKLAHGGITIAVDSLQELERLQGLLPNGKRQPVLLRLNRSLLKRQSIAPPSRFGLDEVAFRESIELLKADSRFRLLGLSFHIDTVSVDEKRFALHRILEELTRLQDAGFDAYVLDIGGGFGSEYHIAPSTFEQYVAELREKSGSGVLWQDVYGTSGKSAHLRGIDTPYDTTGPARFRELLTHASDTSMTLAEELSEHLVELWIEPGASLFSDAGVLATTVIETKVIDDDTLIVIDAHRNQLCFEGNEAPLDPIVLSSGSRQSSSGDAYVIGHLCLESDFISYRKIHFDQLPKEGDVLLWTSVGAYRSNFSTSEAIGHPLPRKFIYTARGENYTLEEEL